MSAQGRTPGIRRPSDHYITPPYAVRRILEALDLPISAHGVLPVHWLDPCAGEGRLIRAANELLIPKGNVRWHACEIRPECAPMLHAVANPVVIGDFLKVVPARYDVVLTNPPYSLAEEFVRACLPVAQHVVMLLRLNWLENRAALFEEHPADVWISPNRLPFARNKHGKIGSDATAYAWMHWHAGATGRVRWLAKTPKEERAAWVRWLDENLPPRANGGNDEAAAENPVGDTLLR